MTKSKNFAVLRILGATRRQLSAVLLKESCFVSITGGVLGTALAGLTVLQNILLPLSLSPRRSGAADQGAAVLLVTHERNTLKIADVIFQMEKGVFTEFHLTGSAPYGATDPGKHITIF